MKTWGFRDLVRRILKPYKAAYPLARRMMVIVILWSILFTFVTAALQTFLDYRREIDELNARLQQIRVIEIPSLINSVWHFDTQQIETQLQGMTNLQDIRYVELRVVGGETFTAGQAIAEADSLSFSAALEYIRDGKTFALGQLRVVADLRSLQERVWNRLFSILFSEGIQIFLLAGFILFMVEWLLTRPLNDIVRYAETMDLEHLEKPLVLQKRRLISSRDELDLVALKLNEMRRRLMQDVAEREQMEAALRESERNYREIFNATSEAIFIHEISSGRILQVNASMLRLYGFATEAEALGSMVPDLSRDESPYGQAEADHYLLKARLEGPQIFEWLARKKTGETFWVEVSLRSSTISGENRILAVVRDITERKRAENLLQAKNKELISQGRALEKAEARTRQLNTELEKRVKERTRQLTDANQELDAFSYSVAHDLRAPLRHMNSFSQIILEDHGGELNENVKKWLQRIQDSGQNLTGMVDALLALSRVTSNELQPDRIDLSELAKTIAADLRQRDPERQIEFLIANGLTVQADKHLMHILLENLLSNAWKFTAQCQPARIELGRAPYFETRPETGNDPIYFVRDNGVGFDMTYANRLFSPFQRYHSAAEFTGTGIGLATVKRIIQRHGGRIWAESGVDQGATFYFTLP